MGQRRHPISTAIARSSAVTQYREGLKPFLSSVAPIHFSISSKLKRAIHGSIKADGIHKSFLKDHLFVTIPRFRNQHHHHMCKGRPVSVRSSILSRQANHSDLLSRLASISIFLYKKVKPFHLSLIIQVSCWVLISIMDKPEWLASFRMERYL
jgi:hypothetical protein